jgi:hypothetical protein
MEKLIDIQKLLRSLSPEPRNDFFKNVIATHEKQGVKQSLTIPKWWLSFFLVLCFSSLSFAQNGERPFKAETNLKSNGNGDSSDLNDQKWIYGGFSAPLDDGRGYPTGYGYFFWKRKGWPAPSSDFKLGFAGVAGDAELTFRSLITDQTDFGCGLFYNVIGGFEEYERGQIDIGNRMDHANVAGRIFVQQHLMKGFAEIGQLRGTYECGYTDYSRHDDTAPTFTIARDGIFHSLKLNAGTGNLKKSNFAPKGWEFNVGGEATFRDNWKRWGPVNLWDSPSHYQKFQLDGTYVASIVKNQKLIAKFTGGVGNNTDRLSANKLGGALTGLPNSLVLHGFYAREILAEDFALLNLDYVLPLLQEQQLALHFYGDGAFTKRSDIPDNSVHGWVGVGSGVSFRGFWDTDWLAGYGYGANAQRGSDHGGHEVFVQMSKKF